MSRAVLLPLCALLLTGCGVADDGGDAAAAGPAQHGRLPQVLDWPLPGAAPGTGAPDLSVTADGRVLLSWLDSQPGRRHLFRFSAWSAAQQRWQHAPATIAVGERMFVNWADTPHIASTLDGALWAHWLQRTADVPYAYDVALVRSGDGANWSAPLVPHRDRTPTEHGFVSMWAHGVDLLGIVWLDGRHTGGDHAGHGADAGHGGTAGAMALRAALVDPAQRLVHEAVIDTRTCECCQTGAVATTRGPLVVYRGRSPDEVRDILFSRLEGNVWTAPRRVHADDWTMPACPVNGPSLDAHGENVVVGWYTAPDGVPEVRLVRSGDAGDVFGEAVTLDRGAQVQGRVAVALDAQRAQVLWLREEGEGQVLWYAHFAPDLSREFGRMELARLQGRGRATGFPRLAVHEGTAYAVWTDVIDGRPQLRGARLSPASGES